MREIIIPVVVKKGNKLIWGEDHKLTLFDTHYTIVREFGQEFPKREDEYDSDSPILTYKVESIKDEYTILKSDIKCIGAVTYDCGSIAVEIIYSNGESRIFMHSYREAKQLKDQLTNWLLNLEDK